MATRIVVLGCSGIAGYLGGIYISGLGKAAKGKTQGEVIFNTMIDFVGATFIYGPIGATVGVTVAETLLCMKFKRKFK